MRPLTAVNVWSYCIPEENEFICNPSEDADKCFRTNAFSQNDLCYLAGTVTSTCTTNLSTRAPRTLFNISAYHMFVVSCPDTEHVLL